MRIGIVCLPERGGYYSTFALAKRLVRKGHDVAYFGPIDFQADVTRQGFEFVTVWQEVFGTDESDPPPVLESWWARTLMAARLARHYAGHPDRWKLYEVLADRYLAGVIRDHGVDLILVDALFQEVIPELAASGVVTRVFATELSSGLRCVPPSVSGAMPRSPLFGTALVRFAWWRCFAMHYLKAAQHQAHGLLLRLLALGTPMTPPRELMRKVRRTRQEDMAQAGLHDVFWEYGWSPQLPEVVLCFNEFDFPEARTERLYLGHCIDLDRAEPDFPWHEIAQDRQLVYVSLGTHAARYARKTQPFLKGMIAVARRLPSLQFVIVLGKGRAATDLGDLPENVVAVPFGPQLALLERAALAITNGGLGTIKECLWFGVPMIVVPCRWDQPGNAARVVFHRVGLRTNIGHVDASTLSRLIQQSLRSRDIKAGMERMSDRCRRSSEQLDAGIDALLAGSARSREGGPASAER